ncbi:MAG: PIN domain-containing protein [Candidatus Thorarchaeota archaeon]
MILIDSSFIIDLMRGKEAAEEKLSELQDNDENLLVSVITLYELYVGVSRVVDPTDEERRIGTAMQSMSSVELNEVAAKRAGLLHGALKRAGETIGPTDALIAGTALSMQAKVLTGNVRHFSVVPGLEIVTY